MDTGKNDREMTEEGTFSHKESKTYIPNLWALPEGVEHKVT